VSDDVSVSIIPTQLAKDAVALERLVGGLTEAHRTGKIRSAVVIYFDPDNHPHLAAANTTLAEESYIIALLQERLLREMAR
jgi:hypothetical protein